MNDLADRGETSQDGHCNHRSDLTTSAVHAGREDLRALGVHAPPLDLSATYPLFDIDLDGEAYDAWARGEASASNPIYARLFSPTVARFEQALAQLEGAAEAVAFASGMAAMTACILAACQARRHIVAIRPLYGGTDHLLSCGLLGVEVSWTDAEHVAEALREETGLVIVENPGNPTLTLVDLDAIVAQAASAPVLVDNTFATPVLQNPLSHGATYSLHSASKFLGGHGDVLAGVIATTEVHARDLRRVRMYTGAVLHPLGAYLLHRGLPTLPLRVERAQQTAEELAARLQTHPAVARVHYPGLAEPLPASLRKGGCLLAFEVAGGRAAAQRTVQELKLVSHAVSLGGVDTLVQHSASFSHRLLEPDALEVSGISPALLRVSVGLEDVDDLWHDLERALTLAHRGVTLTG
jgi:methionine-gamma-lyase